MAKIIIEGVPPWDGTYELDESYFTNRELHTIKKVAGVRAGELADAFQAGDSDIVIALAVIAAARQGTTIPPDDLWDAKAGAIRAEFGEEVDAGPPDVTESGDASASGESTTPSGEASSSTGDPRENGQSLTGSPGLVTSAISGPPI